MCRPGLQPAAPAPGCARMAAMRCAGPALVGGLSPPYDIDQVSRGDPALVTTAIKAIPERTSHEGRYCHRWRGTHPDRRIQRGTWHCACPRTRQNRHQGGDRSRRRRGAAGVRSDHGADPHRRPGHEPGPPGLARRRHSDRSAGLGRQPGLRLRIARGRARLPGHRQRRFRDRRGRRPGIDEPVSALRASAQRREDGQFRHGRHHDQGRPVGRLQRLPHGQHGRERRAPMADHPPAAGRVRGRVAAKSRSRAEGRQVQGRDHAGDRQGPQGRCRRRHRRISQARHHARSHRQIAPRLRQGRHRDGGECVGHQ